MNRLDFMCLFYNETQDTLLLTVGLKNNYFISSHQIQKKSILVVNTPFIKGLIYGDDWMAYNYLCHTVSDET